MLNIFPLVETLDFPEHPAEHGIVYDVIMASAYFALQRYQAPLTRAEIKAVFPLPAPAKGTLKVSGKRAVATGIFNVDKVKMKV
jgi:hypothetical protein